MSHYKKLKDTWIMSRQIREDYTFNKYKNITGIIQIGAHKGEEARNHSKYIGKNMIWIEAQPQLMSELQNQAFRLI